MSYAQNFIHKLDKSKKLNPAGVEANMRLQYGTLGFLEEQDFLFELEIAAECERQNPGYLRDVAASFGLADDFNRWEIELKKVDKC